MYFFIYGQQSQVWMRSTNLRVLASALSISGENDSNQTMVKEEESVSKDVTTYEKAYSLTMLKLSTQIDWPTK
ncbi:hypothetical protein DC345_30295 [Paenibacillus taichungensis]|uniref:Uncharacterized protein n=1 Tax=Paenibacillus taichungensis TaxID=484184 RepID=A0A329QBL8_9BACL|nr:hypothetical protein DC345_30295 [Paenibacillus taichungensis]